jgi:HlyD family secretion protein
MSKKYTFPVVGGLGAAIALCVVFLGQKKAPIAPILFPPATSPYEQSIYGVGIIEASTENIAIGTPFVLPIVKVFVREGDFVQKGSPLLELDTRALYAQKALAEKQLEVSRASSANFTKQFSLYERLSDKAAVSEQEYFQAYYAMVEAQAQVEVSQAALEQVEVDIERATICAPIDGQILQVNAHVGEVYLTESYTVAQPYTNAQTALILMGRVCPLQMRIDIDEEEASRFCKGARATAFVRGNARIHFSMEYDRIEPYIIPKTVFTGDSIERIDTRVLQVIYRFDKGDLPIYPGQLLDIYIESSS